MELSPENRNRLEKAAFALAGLATISAGVYYFRDELGRAKAFVYKTDSGSSLMGKYKEKATDTVQLSLANGVLDKEGFFVETTDMSPEEIAEFEAYVAEERQKRR